jgi:YD repeat-containing protein
MNRNILAAALVMLSVMLEAGGAFAATATRTSAFSYDATSGLLTKEVIEPTDPNLCLVTKYEYDNFGNKKQATTRNCNGENIYPGLNEASAPTNSDAVIAPRTSYLGFGPDSGYPGQAGTDSTGRFPIKSTNHLGHTETKAYDVRFGAMTVLMGPNDITTQWQYDHFGRKTLEFRADGTSTHTSYFYCTGVGSPSLSCDLPQARHLVKVTPKDSFGQQSGPVSTVYFDTLNREIRSETQGLNGAAIYKDTYYDSFGRVSMVSKPYYAIEPINCTTTPSACTVYTYDMLGRAISETQPTAVGVGTPRTITEYSPAPAPIIGVSVKVTISDASGANLPGNSTQSKTTVRNFQGQTVLVRDTQNNDITYGYDPFANLLQTNAAGVITTMTYDLRGRKITTTGRCQESSYRYDLRRTGASDPARRARYDCQLDF